MSIGRAASMARSNVSAVVAASSLPARQKVRERDHLRIVELAQPGPIDHNDANEIRAAPPDGKRLVELLVVLDEQHVRAGIAQDVFDLVRGRGRIDAGADQADTLRADVGVKPLRPVFRQHRDHVAAATANLEQRQPDSAGICVVLAPRHRMPDALALLAQRRSIAPGQAARAKQPGRGVVTFDHDGPAGRPRGRVCERGYRHVFRLFQRCLRPAGFGAAVAAPR